METYYLWIPGGTSLETSCQNAHFLILSPFQLTSLENYKHYETIVTTWNLYNNAEEMSLSFDTECGNPQKLDP